VLAGRARRARRRRAAARRHDRRARAAAALRRPHHRRCGPQRGGRRGGGRAQPARVRPAALPRPPPGPCVHAQRADGSRLAVLVLHRHLDGHRARAPPAREGRARPDAPALPRDGVGGGVPIRALSRSVACALGIAVLAAIATAIAHGTHDGLLVLAMLAPIGALTMVAAHGIARSGALRRQFLAMAVLIVAQLAVVVGLMTAAMFVEGADVFFTVIAAGYSAALGIWSGRLLERRALERLDA